MMYRKIADSILSHKRTHKSIKGLDKVVARHIIALSLCRLDYTQNTTTQLSSLITNVPKWFSLSGTLFYFSSSFCAFAQSPNIFKEDYYEKK